VGRVVEARSPLREPKLKAEGLYRSLSTDEEESLMLLWRRT